MFKLLETTRAAKPFPMTPGAVVSVCLHGALVLGLVIEQTVNSETATTWEEVIEGLTYIAPPDVVSSASELQVRYEDSGGRDGDREANTSDPSDLGSMGRGTGQSSLASLSTNERPSDSFARPNEEAFEDAFSMVEVEQAAERDPASAAPVYPPLLMQQGIEGYAAMRFVVDSAGRVDLMSVRVLDTTRPEFAAAVKAAMPGMRFTPARLGNRPVRQLAEQLFAFKILPTQTSDAADPPSPAAVGQRPR